MKKKLLSGFKVKLPFFLEEVNVGTLGGPKNIKRWVNCSN